MSFNFCRNTFETLSETRRGQQHARAQLVEVSLFKTRGFPAHTPLRKLVFTFSLAKCSDTNSNPPSVREPEKVGIWEDCQKTSLMLLVQPPRHGEF
eukprot:6056006-Amphidinium_carterae.1